MLDEWVSALGDDFVGEDSRIAPGVEWTLVIGKKPTLNADLPLPLRLFPNARLLVPLRDPRDVVLSYFFTMVPYGISSHASISLERTCQYYAMTMRHWLHLRELLPTSRYLEIRYEDLIAHADEELAGLCRFLEIPAVEGMANHRSAKAMRTPTYHEAQRSLHADSIGKWQAYEHWLRPRLQHLRPYRGAFGYL